MAAVDVSKSSLEANVAAPDDVCEILYVDEQLVRKVAAQMPAEDVTNRVADIFKVLNDRHPRQDRLRPLQGRPVRLRLGQPGRSERVCRLAPVAPAAQPGAGQVPQGRPAGVLLVDGRTRARC